MDKDILQPMQAMISGIVLLEERIAQLEAENAAMRRVVEAARLHDEGCGRSGEIHDALAALRATEGSR